MTSSSPRREVEESGFVMPLVAEEARVGKREVVTGRVRVSTRTDHVDELVRQELAQTDVEVSRVPVGALLEPGEAPPGIREEGNVTIVPVIEEVLFVEKRLMLREEIHITRRTATEIVETPVTVRRQRAEIEHIGPEGSVSVNPTQSSDLKE